MGPRGLVVGASSGIGAAIAHRLASLGYAVDLWGRDADRLTRCAEACAEVGPEPAIATVDVTDHDQLAAATAATAERGPLTVAVWAAGIFSWGPADQADPPTWERLMAVNLTAPTVWTPMVLPLLVAAAPSALVYLGSLAGHTAYADNAAYVASKHGLTGLARATFLDVRDADVKVSLVSPGLVSNGAGLLSPAGRSHPDDLLAPADVADAVAYVLSSSARACPTEIQLQPLRTP